MKFKKWQLDKHDFESFEELASKYNITPLTAKVLLSRGYEDQDIAAFLYEDDNLLDPFTIKDMDKGVERVNKAIENGQRICIYGDYDCDGVTSTAVLYRYLESTGADVTTYIPDRHMEGYGLNTKAIHALAEQGVELIITVDNGIVAVNEVDYANSLGIDVVITDHHKPGDTLPKAVAVIDPHRVDCESRFKDLAGVGVVFKFICAMENGEFEEILEFFSDLIALGTIADVMPLTGENRAIVKHGLFNMVNTENLGLQELKKLTGLDTREVITAQDVAFGISPRINAAGRMGHAKDALNLLLTEDEEQALILAADLFEINETRKLKENEAVVALAKLLEEQKQLKQQKVLTFVKDNLHQGVIGIVAARILDKLQKPVLVITNDEESGLYKGSGRSVDGFSLKEALDYCSDLLQMYGGHDKAAGFSLKKEDLQAFCEKINEYAGNNFESMPVDNLKIDLESSLEELNLQNIKGIAVLEPLGEGNDEPSYLLKNATVTGVYPMAQGKHTRVRLKQGNVEGYVNYFKMKTVDFPYETGHEVDVVVKAAPNYYNGTESVSLTLCDIRISGLPFDIETEEALYNKAKDNVVLNDREVEQLLPTRDDLAVIYKAIAKNSLQTGNLEFFYIHYCKEQLSYAKFLLTLRVLSQEKLIGMGKEKGKVILKISPVKAKVDLEQAVILKNLKQDKCVWGLCT